MNFSSPSSSTFSSLNRFSLSLISFASACGIAFSLFPFSTVLFSPRFFSIPVFDKNTKWFAFPKFRPPPLRLPPPSPPSPSHAFFPSSAALVAFSEAPAWAPVSAAAVAPAAMRAWVPVLVAAAAAVEVLVLVSVLA
ncbi:hypothetical protein BO71DRAFT_241869 [Aspergillus ellipticus CBS 707.79]|uniref:Uncharacterized protein n=1 Tax=Aspergillus ellipticus CBS 707.79 TaxID=1448320 RepID=A0A319D9G2_9EURO|nr:hypothetical protein BO71DRAFT_241869 [Aspergillus ellipticus CBS 707.79]